MKYYKTYNVAAVLFLVAFSGFVGMLFFGSEPQPADAVQMPQQAVLKQPLSSDNGSSGTNLVSVDDISDGAYTSIDNDEESFFMRNSLGELSPIEISSGDLGSSTDLASEMDLGAESGTRTIQSGSADAAASAVAADASGTGSSGSAAAGGAGSSGTGSSGSSGAGSSDSTGTGGSGSSSSGSGSSSGGGGGSVNTALTNNVYFQGDISLLEMKIEKSYVTDGAFLVVTTGARFDYVPNALKLYQGLGNDKRLLSTIILGEAGPFTKVEETDDHVLLQSENFNIGIYGDSTCLIGVKQSCTLMLKSNFEPVFRRVSDERTVLSDILGGLIISPRLNGGGFSIKEKSRDLQLNLTKEQVVIFRAFSTISDKSLLLTNNKNPQAIREITEGKRTVANAAWWGFNKDDSTSALQAAINSGAKKVVVPCIGTGWIVKPIKLAGNQEVIFGSGVVVCAKKSGFEGQNASLFNVNKKSNIKIRGYGATFHMQKEEYIKPGYPKGESRMAISIFDSSNIEITGLNLSDSGGDGIFIGTDARSYYGYCENIVVKDCVCDNNYRQGISITSARNVLIDNCIFQNTNGTAPSAGIDLEPSNNTHKLTGIMVSNCISQSNAGAGFGVYLKHLSSKTEDISVLFINCIVRKCGKSGLLVGAINDDGPGGIVEFRDCTITDLREPGVYIFDKSPKSAKLRFTNCKLSNVAGDRKTSYQNFTLNSSPIHFLVRDTKLANSIGGVEFINCSVYDNNDRPAIKILNRGRAIEGIEGVINVYTDYQPRIESDSKGSGVDVLLKRQPVQLK